MLTMFCKCSMLPSVLMMELLGSDIMKEEWPMLLFMLIYGILGAFLSLLFFYFDWMTFFFTDMGIVDYVFRF
jgi:hypothetical protein